MVLSANQNDARWFIFERLGQFQVEIFEGVWKNSTKKQKKNSKSRLWANFLDCHCLFAGSFDDYLAFPLSDKNHQSALRLQVVLLDVLTWISNCIPRKSEIFTNCNC